MTKELTKRILTSLFLIILLIIAFSYSYMLIILLIIISIIAWIEFNTLISKIFTKKIFKINFLILSLKGLTLIYLTFFSVLIFQATTQIEPNFKLEIIYLFSICISSDIGGLTFGKILKVKNLQK